MNDADIIEVTKYIKYYINNRFVNESDWLALFEELCYYIVCVLQRWSGNSYVGIEKEETKRNIFQNFFVQLKNLIVYLTINKDEICSLERMFINCIKYNGKLYRYLGHGDFSNKRKKVKPNYNDIFVSWSKEEENSYIESKLYGKMTRLYCDTSNKYFGIDLESFQEFYNKTFNEQCYISKGNEREVVFPTIEEAIYKIEYL